MTWREDGENLYGEIEVRSEKWRKLQSKVDMEDALMEMLYEEFAP